MRIFLFLILLVTTQIEADDYRPLFIENIEKHSSQCALDNITIREIASSNNQGWFLYAQKAQWFASLSRILTNNVSIDFLFNNLTFHLYSKDLWVNSTSKDVWSNSHFQGRCDEGTFRGEEFFFSFKDSSLYFPCPIEVSFLPLKLSAGEGTVCLQDESITLSKGVKTQLFISCEP